MTPSMKSVWNSRSTFIKLSENPLYYGQTGKKCLKFQRSAIDMKKCMEFQCPLYLFEQVGEQKVWNSIDNLWEKRFGIPMS